MLVDKLNEREEREKIINTASERAEERKRNTKKERLTQRETDRKRVKEMKQQISMREMLK